MINSSVLINPSMYHIRSLENLLAIKKSVIVSFLDRIMVRVHSSLDLTEAPMQFTHTRVHACRSRCTLKLAISTTGGTRREWTRTKESAQSPAKGIRPIEIRLPFVSVRTDVIPLAAVRRLAKTNFLVTMMRWFRIESAKSALRRKVGIPTRARMLTTCIQTCVHR